MSIRNLPTYTIHQIMANHPNGCFIFMLDWQTDKTRVRRNTLPMFVKPVEFQDARGNPVFSLYKHRLDGTRLTSVPYNTYHVATTEHEAVQQYSELLEFYSKRRLNYVNDTITSTETYVQNLKTKISTHKVR